MRPIRPLLFVLALALGGCAGQEAPKTEAAFEPFPDIVDYAFVKQYATIPPSEAAVVVDSRPAKRRYDDGHIPGALNLPDTFFAKLAPKVLPADKSKLVIFYCNGLDCALSHKSAFKARDMGYANVKVYAAGYPDWIANGETGAVSLAYVKDKVDNPDGTVLIDSRPKRRFDEGTIPGAINIPDTFFDKLTAKLPADKKTPLLFFCGGMKCELSGKSAVKAKALGYTNVMVFPEGEPAWTAAYGKK